MTQELPTVTVIVLNWNGREYLSDCFDSLVALDYPTDRLELMMVDNGSTDDSVAFVRQHYPHVTIVETGHNLGFAGGNNLGLRQATGEIVFLMNSDVLAAADNLQALAHQFDRQPDAGVISAGLRTITGEAQAFAYGDDPTLAYLLRRGLHAVLNRGPLHRWDVDQPVETEWVSGACIAVRHEVIQQVGLLDERFQLYFEDNDWCLRIRQAGWKVIYDPRFSVTHLGGQSQPQRRMANQLYYQSMIKFYAKHYGTLKTLLLRALLAPYQAFMISRR